MPALRSRNRPNDSGTESSEAMPAGSPPGESSPTASSLCSQVQSRLPFLKERYAFRYNSAVAKASRGNLTPMAPSWRTFGTLNTKQGPACLDHEAERKRNRRNTPRRPVRHFLEIIAAGDACSPEVEGKTDDDIKFLQAFDPEFRRSRNPTAASRTGPAGPGGQPQAKASENNYDP